MKSASAPPAAINHYENFPVASWLCPARLRAPISAIYHFARTADDLADEGDLAAEQRLKLLQAYRQDLHLCAAGSAIAASHWSEVFLPLQQQIAQYHLPVTLLDDLLSAFMQDVRKTHAAEGYADRDELLDYCKRSANPVGRLLLHLYGITHEKALQQSDAICSALQLINFWQDLSEDVPRKRWYIPLEDCQHFDIHRNVQQQAVAERRQDAKLTAVVKDLTHWAEQLMLQGSPLVFDIPGRAGWELRLVVQGGLQILRKIRDSDYQCFVTRPTIGKLDAPGLALRAIWMQ